MIAVYTASFELGGFMGAKAHKHRKPPPRRAGTREWDKLEIKGNTRQSWAILHSPSNSRFIAAGFTQNGAEMFRRIKEGINA